MKGFQLSSGVILIAIGLFSLQTQLVSAAYTMNETCSYVTEGWIADPDCCQCWGYCNGGKLIGTGKCGAGFLYNSRAGTCDYADKVTCASTVADSCKHIQTPQMVPDPNDCSNFCYCDGNGGSQCGQCPAKQFYDPTKQVCVWGNAYSCPANSVCRLVPNNQFVGDPDQCGQYIRCLDGSGTSNNCGKQFYNPLKGMCQNMNPCSGDDTNNGTNTDTSGPGVSTPLNSGKFSDVCAGITNATFVTDKATCMGAYFCPEVNATNPAPDTVNWTKCPLGTHFNPTLQKCVTAFTYNCPYDRCGNINQDYVTMVYQKFDNATACKSYMYCKNQTALKNVNGYEFGTCPTDFPYFNEEIGSCTDANPGFDICKAA